MVISTLTAQDVVAETGQPSEPVFDHIHNAREHLVEVVLNQRAPLVCGIARSLDVLFRPSRVAVSWSQT